MKPLELAAIGLKAIEFQQAHEARRATRVLLKRAYQDWKSDQGIGRVERDTAQWDAMMMATNAEYDAFCEASNEYRKTFDRLNRSCKAIVKTGVAA